MSTELSERIKLEKFLLEDGGVEFHIDDENFIDFEDNLELEEANFTSLPKKRVDQFLSETCQKIKKKKNNKLIKKGKIAKTTRYFTPLFKPGSNGGLRSSDRKACINIEGSCVVGNYLYNFVSVSKPWGKRYNRPEVFFKFGKGNGKSRYNTTNALDPCRTVAADQSQHPAGTVIYIPEMEGKLCPQNGKAIDGCFIVGDVGAAIKGKGRFDLFTGECSDYNKRTNTCRDSLNAQFGVEKGTEYYIINRHNMLAKELREETDLFIEADWLKSVFPM